MKVKVLITQLCLTLCDPMYCMAHQAPLSMEFFRQEYWSGLPFSSPEDLLNPGTEPRSPALLAESLPCEPAGEPRRAALGPSVGWGHSLLPRRGREGFCPCAVAVATVATWEWQQLKGGGSGKTWLFE